MNARARKKIIQFPHPSGEECSKNIVNGVKRWNDGRHKRNFIEILGFAISVAVLFFTACGDSGSSASGFESDFSYTEETLDDLPNCTAEREQDTAFVRDGNEIYVCEDSRWKFVRAVIDSVKTVDDLSACTNSREGDSVLVTSLNAVYVCGDGKWYKVDVEDLLESSSSVSPGSSSDGWEKLPSSSSSSLLVVSSSSEAVSSSSSVLVVSSSSEVVSSSSSLLVVSSSSEVVSSSSSPAVSYGKLTDARDGQVYKTVQIGEQIWMAENLNYAYNEGTAQSYCYNNSADSCAKYGRLYLWSAAMDSAAVFGGCGYGSTCGAGSATTEVRGVCPAGWHLPSRAEFETLFAAVGGQDVAGTVLKSTSGWMEDGNGTDVYGFSALPAGYYNDGNFFNVGSNATFWSATEGSSNYAYAWYLSAGSAYLNGLNKGNGSAVRCLRNSPL
ncbi:major paralogous domain-containing protein [Fibrobacter intestinalis]|uniref:Major paralogous domain-containing protein n=1 Tax=Fibrobacter intestinalis TaxID=28122 RepID=A0A1M6SDJ6_9BACT|nr:fibrobacter succinogenes major paralogous domain-containing protein [Fibrobacter intestinalis]SHK42745.1 major paralogous domain-containing protein [Fibrobacter intestinalis]